MGYYRSQGQARDGQAIDIGEGPLMGPRNSAAEILQVEQHKYPGDRSSRNCRVMVRETPVTSFKLQAASFKRQAASGKLHNLRALIKFQASSDEVLC